VRGTKLDAQFGMSTTYNSVPRVSSLVFLLCAGLTGCKTTPSTAQSTPISSPNKDQLSIAREKHAAVALVAQDGTRLPEMAALVIGGIEGPPGSTSFADIFNGDPDHQSWRSSLHSSAYSNFGVNELARLDLRATVMSDGRVLVTGGSVCVTYQDSVPTPCMNGMEGCKCDVKRLRRGTALLFDPAGTEYNRWADAGWMMNTRRTRHTVTRLHAKAGESGVDYVFVLGGEGKSLRDTAELFKYMGNSATPMNDSLPEIDLKDGTITLPDGGVTDSGVIDGGAMDGSTLSDWIDHTATLLPEKEPSYDTDRILVVGRIMPDKPCSAYLVQPGLVQPGNDDPSKAWENAWSEPLNLPAGITLPCEGHMAEVIGVGGSEMIAIVGGQSIDGSLRKEVVLFDPREKKFLSTVLMMKTEHAFGATGVLDSGSLLIAGGNERSTAAEASRPGQTIERCSLATGICSTLETKMKCARVHHTMTKLGRIKWKNPKKPMERSLAEHFLVVGGSTGDENPDCKAIGDVGNSSETLYPNETCGITDDCSEGNECLIDSGKTIGLCRPSKK
jgi:hypothetical protein